MINELKLFRLARDRLYEMAEADAKRYAEVPWKDRKSYANSIRSLHEEIDWVESKIKSLLKEEND